MQCPVAPFGRSRTRGWHAGHGGSARRARSVDDTPCILFSGVTRAKRGESRGCAAQPRDSSPPRAGVPRQGCSTAFERSEARTTAVGGGALGRPKGDCAQRWLWVLAWHAQRAALGPGVACQAQVEPLHKSCARCRAQARRAGQWRAANSPTGHGREVRPTPFIRRPYDRAWSRLENKAAQTAGRTASRAGLRAQSMTTPRVAR